MYRYVGKEEGGLEQGDGVMHWVIVGQRIMKLGIPFCRLVLRRVESIHVAFGCEKHLYHRTYNGSKLSIHSPWGPLHSPSCIGIRYHTNNRSPLKTMVLDQNTSRRFRKEWRNSVWAYQCAATRVIYSIIRVW